MSLHLEIAEVSFGITSRGPDISGELPSVYDPFLNRTGAAGRPSDVPIIFERDHIPDLEKMRKVFDTGESWSMFADGKDYLMVLAPPLLNRRVVWAARFNSEFREVTVYCSDEFIAGKEGWGKVLSPFFYPLDQILLMFFLAKGGGAIFHGAGMSLRGRGCIFLGRSGAGKSTLSRLLSKSKDAEILSDDRMIVRERDTGFRAYGTPWPGDAGIGVNKGVGLEAVFLIGHGKENKIREIGRRGALERLLSMTSIPWFDEIIMSDILLFCDEMLSRVPAYELDFVPSDEVIGVLEKFLPA